MKTRKKRIDYTSIIRRAVQLISFILAPGFFITVFSSLKSVYTAIADGKFSLGSLLPQILLLLAVIPVTIFFGRFFCGFICSFGSLGDLVWFISRKLRRRPARIGEKADRALKAFKYVFLVLIIIAIWTLGVVSFDNSLNPWNIFGMYASLSGWPSASGLLTVGSALLLLIIVGSFFVERFFCRYICPLGAAFAILSRLRLLKITKPKEVCGNCRLCTLNCPAGISMYRYDKINSGECINCFKCAGVCPRKNITAAAGGQDIAPLAAGLTAAVAMMGLYYVGRAVPESVSYNSTQTAVIQTVDSVKGRYTDGTYTGSADGYKGTTNVQVTVSNGYIKDIEILSTGDDSEFFGRAKNQIVGSILSAQSTTVDVVSGATYSSNGIIEAVADALGTVFTTDSPAASPSPSASDPGIVSPSPSATAPETVSPSPSVSGKYTDGTYTGSGTGLRGKTTVSVTVSGGAITDIKIVSYKDDRPYFKKASGTVIKEIIASQSIQVDTVSGATYSSNGIIEAVANALG